MASASHLSRTELCGPRRSGAAEDKECQVFTASCSTRSLAPTELPCRRADADLWFAESPDELEQAKQLCAQCPVRLRCLTAALQRAEPWGVWGGEIFDQGAVVARKRPRGRPRKKAALTGSAA